MGYGNSHHHTYGQPIVATGLSTRSPATCNAPAKRIVLGWVIGRYFTINRASAGKINQYRLYCKQKQSAYRSAERISTNRLPPRLVRVPRWRRRQKNARFYFISHSNRGSKLHWPGVAAVINTEKKGFQTKKHATCGHDVTIFFPDRQG